MDTLVFDIETQNFFTDAGVGRDNFEALKISVVGMYSYNQGKYFCFEESEMRAAADLFEGSSRIVGFSINRYDVPVLQAYFNRFKEGAKPDLWQKERVDLLKEIEMATGSRISLSKVAEANLGAGKDKKGAEAPELFRAGKIAELKEYCLKDVRLTKEIYDLYRKQGFLMVPERGTGKLLKIVFTTMAIPSARLF
ncbi:MAG: ribonuclease H-like domain-containing protein [Candidatus Liptonbacteria bacterium]|nr:ribonuclease H-like domain-containing protein [Candidatus Liptonbacteria bacterium]